MYASSVVAFTHLHTYDLDLWSLTLKTLAGMDTHIVNMGVKFRWNISVKYGDIASCRTDVNGRTTDEWTTDTWTTDEGTRDEWTTDEWPDEQHLLRYELALFTYKSQSFLAPNNRLTTAITTQLVHEPEPNICPSVPLPIGRDNFHCTFLES